MPRLSWKCHYSDIQGSCNNLFCCMGTQAGAFPFKIYSLEKLMVSPPHLVWCLSVSLSIFFAWADMADQVGKHFKRGTGIEAIKWKYMMSQSKRDGSSVIFKRWSQGIAVLCVSLSG
uniref:Uncharacterized protein n=1 Tax=Aegilops tauschii subsp. strangulata TaxID=200361 RepID=A0A453DWC3_AEGTS